MPIAMPAFDTYKYVRTLRDAGFTEAQAEAQSSALMQAQDAHVERLVTKDDLLLLGTELRGEMSELRMELRGEMKSLREEMNHRFNNTKMLLYVIGAGVAAALPKLYFP